MSPPLLLAVYLAVYMLFLGMIKRIADTTELLDMPSDKTIGWIMDMSPEENKPVTFSF